MKLYSISFWAALTATCLSGISSAFAQGAPNIVWETPTPNGLANSIIGAGWAPGLSGQVAVGSTDRWMRTRQSGNGALIYSVLQPQHSSGADQTIYSINGKSLAVHNESSGLTFRVYRAVDGVFLGTITGTVDANGIVQFTSNAQRQTNPRGDTPLPGWRIEEFTTFRSTGSGYNIVTTTFNFSPDGVYQSALTSGSLKIQRRSDGSIVRTLSVAAQRDSTAVSFTPDSTAIAVWAGTTNKTTLWRIADGALLMQFPDAVPEEGIGAIRFTPDGMRLITSGYLAYVDSQGLWQQVGLIRFWRVADGAMRRQYDQHTGIGVTSPVALSPDGTQFAYGTYEGTAVVARIPAP
jgi:WD40 repeat protein